MITIKCDICGSTESSPEVSWVSPPKNVQEYTQVEHICSNCQEQMKLTEDWGEVKWSVPQLKQVIGIMILQQERKLAVSSPEPSPDPLPEFSSQDTSPAPLTVTFEDTDEEETPSQRAIRLEKELLGE